MSHTNPCLQGMCERSIAQRRKDIELSVTLTMFEAAFGCEIGTQGHIADNCAACGGAKISLAVHYPWDEDECFACSSGLTPIAGCNCTPTCMAPCLHCERTRMLLSCWACSGTGLGPMRRWSAPAKIPAGVKDRSVVRIRGFGDASGVAGLHGDLVVTVQIEKNEMFRLTKSGRLETFVPVSYWTWLAGGKVLAPLLDGTALVQFTPMEHEIKVAGQGWPTSEGSLERGDLIVHLVPQDVRLKVSQRKFFEQMAREERNKQLDSWDREIGKWAQGSPESRFNATNLKSQPAMKRSRSASS
ncbi:DnaJ C-terminal domain-containing protein [Limnohabitans sp.]|uniref:DnaJ C-terminal domain-containing protein n=1 Tax=Limnohabitans sp. TaxID=1907725 RepID=UPI00260B1405|nr:DnaJ C-terminal domain-containing protein [Limnohabitans sp.]